MAGGAWQLPCHPWRLLHHHACPGPTTLPGAALPGPVHACRLLEVRVLELESEEGTGPLERDELALAASKAAAAAAAAAGGGEGAGQQQQAARRRHACLVYRAGQKRLAREWLVRSKAELTELLRVMACMHDRAAALERAQLGGGDGGARPS